MSQVLSQEHTGFSVWMGDPFQDEQSDKFVARYVERGPLSLEKLSIEDGQNGMEPATASLVVYTTKDGTTHEFDALEVLALLSSHIPNSYESITRYYGYYSCRARGERNPHHLCPEEVWGSGLEVNVIILRQKNDDGTWPFSWQVRALDASSFAIRKVGECLTPRMGCQYEVKFALDKDGVPLIHKDTQVLIQVPIRLDSIPETGDGFNSTMVIPMLIRADHVDADPTPTPAPTAPPTDDGGDGDDSDPDSGGGDDDSASLSGTVVSQVAQALALIKTASKNPPKKKGKKAKKQKRRIKRAQRNLNDVISLLKDLYEANMSEIGAAFVNFSGESLSKAERFVKAGSRTKLKKKKRRSLWNKARKEFSALGATRGRYPQPPGGWEGN